MMVELLSGMDILRKLPRRAEKRSAFRRMETPDPLLTPQTCRPAAAGIRPAQFPAGMAPCARLWSGRAGLA